jgi:hypothetical protein
LGILFSSIPCTRPNQSNLFNVIVSVIVDFFTTAWIILLINILQLSFHCHILCLKFFYTLSFKKC